MPGDMGKTPSDGNPSVADIFNDDYLADMSQERMERALNDYLSDLEDS